ncbi:MAG: hypothetical protein KDB00_29205 [Planctomycetales bacterium]|nr:hypothetical protein [Planctomycetales bacterium]
MKLIVAIILGVLMSIQAGIGQDAPATIVASDDVGNHQNIEALQKQLDEAEALADQIVAQMLTANQDDEKGLPEFEALSSKLIEAVRASFEVQQKLHTAQLADAESKIVASRKRIAERELNSKAIVAARVQTLLVVPEQFRSPKAAIKEIERCARQKDYDGLVNMLTDDGAELLAGLMLQSMTSMSQMMMLMEATGQPLDGMEQLIVRDTKRYMRPNPSPEATAAMAKITGTFPQLFYQLGATSADGTPLQPPVFDKGEYADRLRKASGVLVDPRAYTVAMMKAASAMGDDEKNTESVPSNWKITVDGTLAMATQLSTPIDHTALKTGSIELRIELGRWKVSKFVSDEDLMEYSSAVSVSPVASPVAGPVVSNSGIGNASSVPVYSPASPYASYPAPYQAVPQSALTYSPSPYSPAPPLRVSPYANRIRTFREQIQGNWKVKRLIESGVEEAPESLGDLEVAIDGDIMRFKQRPDVGTFLIEWKGNDTSDDERKQTYEVDFINDPNGVAETYHGIIGLDGQTLRVCFASEPKSQGNDFRPAIFLSGAKVILYECVRVENPEPVANVPE